MRRVTKVALVFGTLGTLVGGSWCAWSSTDLANYTGTVEEQVRASHAAGMATSYSAIRARHPVGPGNAAPVYVHLTNRMQANGNAVSRCLRGEASAAQIEALLKAEAGTLKEVRLASRMPFATFERNWELGPEVEYPEYGPMKVAAKKFLLRAINRNSKGNFSGAEDDVETAFCIANQIMSQSDPYSKTVGANLLGVVMSTLTKLAEKETSQPRLLRFLAMTDKVKLPDMHEYLEVAAIQGAESFDYLASHNPDNSYVIVSDPILRIRSFRTAFQARSIEEYRRAYLDLPRNPENTNRLRGASNRAEQRRDSDTFTIRHSYLELAPITTDRIALTVAAYRTITLATIDQALHPCEAKTVIANRHSDPWTAAPIKIDDDAGFYSVGRNQIDDHASIDDVVERLDFSHH